MRANLIVAGRTGPNHLVRFGETGAPLDERGRADVSALAEQSGPVSCGPVICGPERAARETASLLSLTVLVDARLASLDVGAWTGLLPEQVSGTELGAWFGDPSARPHGGESIVAFVGRIKVVGRIKEWASPAPSLTLVVASPVAQALLCRDAASFFDVAVVPGRGYQL